MERTLTVALRKLIPRNSTRRRHRDKMINKAYFANAANDAISVNLNEALKNAPLAARRLSPNGAAVVLSTVAYSIGPNKGKGTFGTGDVNKLQVEFATLRAD